MRTGEYYAGGLSLRFFNSPEFEVENRNDSEQNAVIIGRNLLRVIMMGWRDNWTDLISMPVIKAVLNSRDHQLTRGFRLAFQQGLLNVYEQLRHANLTQLQHNQAQLFINNCLMFLPYADLSPYESLAIPQWVGDSWQLVDYKVTPIELTPQSGLAKLFLEDNDRTFAYGLDTIQQSDAESHLIFMGTTYPQGQGFYSTLETNLQPFATVGEMLYRSGRANVNHWLDKQPKKIHVCGTSLGGALALLVAIDQGNRISRVDALNPPGLYNSWSWRRRLDHWDTLETQPPVFIQRQGNDPVSRLGAWKKEWHLLHAQPTDPQRRTNQFTDHGTNYAGFSDTRFVVLDTEEDTRNNRRRSFWVYSFLRIIGYLTILLPTRYLLLPLFRLLANNKLQLSLLIPLILLSLTLSPLTGGFASLSLAFASLGNMSFLLAMLIKFIQDQLTGSRESPLTKFLAFLKEHPRLTAGLLVSLTAAGGMSLLFPTLIPLTLPTVVTTLTVAPLAMTLLHKLGKTMQTLFGYNPNELSQHHDPSLPRNQLLDLYTNNTEATFTQREISHYNVAKAWLGNEFVPAPQGHNDPVTLVASKAKVHDMTQTLQLMGLQFHGPRLRAALQENQEEYARGESHALEPR